MKNNNNNNPNTNTNTNNPVPNNNNVTFRNTVNTIDILYNNTPQYNDNSSS